MHLDSLGGTWRCRSPISPIRDARGRTRRRPPTPCCAGATATSCSGGSSPIGLTEHAEQYVRRGYSPAGSARGYVSFRRRGMPFATQPRPRVTATGQACRAIVATRLQAPELEHAVFRALQFGWFTTPLVMEDHDDLAVALRAGRGARRRRDRRRHRLDPEVEAAYQADRAEARTAEGTPTEAQGKAARTDGAGPLHGAVADLRARGPAPRGRRLPAHRGLRRRCSPTSPRQLERTPPPQDPLEALEAFDRTG